MKALRLALAALTLVVGSPSARAVNQVASSAPPPVAAGPAASPPVVQPRCPCDEYGFKPLDDKARAVADYWSVRRTYHFTTGLTALLTLLGYGGGDARGAYQAKQSYEETQQKYLAARERAVAFDGIRFGADDFKDPVEFRLKLGVDYVIERPK